MSKPYEPHSPFKTPNPLAARTESFNPSSSCSPACNTSPPSPSSHTNTATTGTATDSPGLTSSSPSPLSSEQTSVTNSASSTTTPTSPLPATSNSTSITTTASSSNTSGTSRIPSVSPTSHTESSTSDSPPLVVDTTQSSRSTNAPNGTVSTTAPGSSSGSDMSPTNSSTPVTRESSAGATDATSQRNSPFKNSKHTGVIAAVLRRRRRASRTAPSSEFMQMARNGGTDARLRGGTTPTFARLNGATTPAGDQPLPYSHQDGSVESGSDDPPPLFTEGWFYGYTDPVLDKVREAADMREQYRRRSESFATAREFKLGDDESKGHESEPDDSTEEGDSIFGMAL
ncbi:hypothetical protein PYCCODRAFT_502507 [Trametes coccinea BRFM310]|uniref:Uncharacterized protein n=1 Tax=Trametes coccinea (strain BRFM310) TaxID=1353009 RepID=A0A1Y2IM08_TRAC3|nr:hypothetical protein PYCCODRAFT_502507 [Trametes coccinea BRFM310]